MLDSLIKTASAKEIFAKTVGMAALPVQPALANTSSLASIDVHSITLPSSANMSAPYYSQNIFNSDSIAVPPRTNMPVSYYSQNLSNSDYYNSQGLQPDIPGVGVSTA